MILTAKLRDHLLRRIERGLFQAINEAHEAHMLDGMMFDVVGLFSIATAGMLNRAASQFNVDLTQRDTEENTLLHALAKSSLHVVHVPKEEYVDTHKDYYVWAIEVLVKHGLSFEDTNLWGQTPMDVARKNYNQGFCEAYDLFLEKQKNKQEEIMQCSII